MTAGRTAPYIIAIGVAVAGRLVRPVDAADVSASPAGASAAMRVYVDPETGRPIPPPPGAAAEAAPIERQRSGEGLVEEPSPAGGVVMHLQGRFKTPTVATVAPDGTVRIGHEPVSAEPDAR